MYDHNKLVSSGTNNLNAKSLVNLNIQTNVDSANKIKKNRNIRSDSLARPKTSTASKKQRKNYPKPEQKVASLINDELLRQNSTGSLFQEYKMANLKANLQKLQTQKKCNLLELNHVELDDDEQINYYLSELCKQHPEVDIGKMLDVEVEKVVKNNQEDKLNEIIEKRINQEELDQLISQDEKAKLVQVYKESRYDQFEPEYSKKNKLKMTTFKKQKEIQDKLFGQLFEDEMNGKSQKQDMTKFLRTPSESINNKIKRRLTNSKPHSQRQSPMVSQFESRPQTAMMQNTQSQTFLTSKKQWDGRGVDPESQIVMQEIIGNCVDLEAEQKKEKKSIKRKINKLDKDIQRSVRTVSEQFNNQEKQSVSNEGFKKFQSETQFKRKLIGFLLNQVADKTEVLSQKARQQTAKNFIQKIQKIDE